MVVPFIPIPVTWLFLNESYCMLNFVLLSTGTNNLYFGNSSSLTREREAKDALRVPIVTYHLYSVHIDEQRGMELSRRGIS